MQFTNKFGQFVKVVKNPKSWRYSYSVRAHYREGKKWYGPLIASQHKTKKAAEAAARTLRNKDVLVVLGWDTRRKNITG